MFTTAQEQAAPHFRDPGEYASDFASAGGIILRATVRQMDGHIPMMALIYSVHHPALREPLEVRLLTQAATWDAYGPELEARAIQQAAAALSEHPVLCAVIGYSRSDWVAELLRL